MRRVRRSTAFRRDARREDRGRYQGQVEPILRPVLAALADDVPLPAVNRDHALAGQWTGYRECHVRPDLLLVYRKSDPDSLQLVRLGSHALLFGR
jgi:mRNA interferase YafQ